MEQKHSLNENSNKTQRRKSDYHKQLNTIIENITNEKTKPTLLLHACCAPCSSYVIEYLSKYFDITIFYYNPNIHPETEYTRRLQELINFLPKFPEAVANKVKLVQAPYDTQDYFDATKVLEETELQTEEERGERCRRCYYFRMQKAQKYAIANNFDYFTTTLSISPYKDAEKINTIGKELEILSNGIVSSKSMSLENEKLTNVSTNHSHQTKYLPADFKKNSGFLRSTQISKEYNLWRQDYCGCIYSKQNMHHPE